MALQKEIIKENGIVCNYHRVSNLNLDVDNKCVYVKIKTYVNQEMRDKEKRYIEISKLISEKEKMIALHEITREDKEYLNLIIEKESLPSNTVIEEKEYRLEKTINVDTVISVTEIYNLLKANHGVFIDSMDI